MFQKQIHIEIGEQNMSDDIDTIIKVLYLDPLVATYSTTFTDAKQRERVMEGDFHINAYIPKLDEEIFSDTPILTPKGDEQWLEDNLSAMAIQLLDKGRLHGWAVVQFYDEGPLWRVFSELEKTTWITDESKNIIGVKVNYGTVTDEECLFDEKQCYLFKFKQGNNIDKFAYADLDQAMWTVATIAREIQNQLDVMARKPEFYHIVYGTPTPAQRQVVMNALDDTSVLNAFGMNEDAVKEIKVINHESYDKLQNAIDKKTMMFSGLTRLPLAFYKGERTSGSGTGGAAENVVELKIEKRKVHIFNKLKPILTQIYADRYGIILTDIELEQIEVEPITDEPNKLDDKIGQEN